jgi:hypothetical protein
LKVQERSVTLTIEPGRGDVSVVPPQRTQRLIFHRVTRPTEVTVTINSRPHDAVTRYDQKLQRFTLEISAASGDQVEITVRPIAQEWMARDDRREQRFRRMLRTFRMDSVSKQWIDQYRAEIFEDPELLKEFGAAVKDAHIEALRSVIQ